jgi:hypothetical protein
VVAAAGPVTSIAFDPTGRRFATAGGSVRLWFTGTLQQPGATLGAVQGAGSTAAFSSDGRTLVGVDDRGHGFAWPVSVAGWTRRACAVAGRDLTRPEWSRFVPGRPYARICP